MQITKLDQPKSEIVFTVVISKDEVKESFQKQLEKISQEAEIKGFRKGKAPLPIVEQNIDKKVIYEEVVKDLVAKGYEKALDQEKINPITPPRVELVSAKDDSDWTFRYTTCTRPSVKLKNYKKAISDLKASKKPKLIIPGKNEPSAEEQKPTLDELLRALLAETEVEISDLLVEDEANRQLAKLIDQLQKVGLNIDQYLSSKNTTAENLRSEYFNQSRDALKLEFILDEIANSEGVTVTEEDINKALSEIKDEKEREVMKNNTYYLANVIKKQKTITSLGNL